MFNITIERWLNACREKVCIPNCLFFFHFKGLVGLLSHKDYRTGIGVCVSLPLCAPLEVDGPAPMSHYRSHMPTRPRPGLSGRVLAAAETKALASPYASTLCLCRWLSLGPSQPRPAPCRGSRDSRAQFFSTPSSTRAQSACRVAAWLSDSYQLHGQHGPVSAFFSVPARVRASGALHPPGPGPCHPLQSLQRWLGENTPPHLFAALKVTPSTCWAPSYISTVRSPRFPLVSGRARWKTPGPGKRSDTAQGRKVRSIRREDAKGLAKGKDIGPNITTPFGRTLNHGRRASPPCVPAA